MVKEFEKLLIDEGPFFVGRYKKFILYDDFYFVIATKGYDYAENPERVWSGGIMIGSKFSKESNKRIFKKDLFDGVEIIEHHEKYGIQEFAINFKESQFEYVYEMILHVLRTEGIT